MKDIEKFLTVGKDRWQRVYPDDGTVNLDKIILSRLEGFRTQYAVIDIIRLVDVLIKLKYQYNDLDVEKGVVKII